MTVSGPEVLHGDIRNKATVYHGVSLARAAEGDVWGAVHAAFAASVAVVQTVVLERVLMASPRPEQQLLAVGQAVSAALDAYAATPSAPRDAREAVVSARAGMEAAFDTPILRLLPPRYLSVDHLAGLPVPDAAAGAHASAARLQGETPTDFVSSRRASAHADGIVALGLLNEGHQGAAVEAAYRSDLTNFEAYLVESAVAAGDDNLATVDLRWYVAYDAIASIPALPDDFAGAVTTIREKLAWAVGPIEANRLNQRLAALLRTA